VFASGPRLWWTVVTAALMVVDQMVQNQLGWGWFASMFLVQFGVREPRHRMWLTAASVALAVAVGGWRVLLGH